MSTINTYSDIDRRDKLTAKFEEIDNTIYVEEVSLTAANIIAMNATPVEVIAAKGAGTVIEVVGVTYILDYGTTAFTGGGVVTLQLDGELVTTGLTTAFLYSAGDTVRTDSIIDGGYLMQENTAITISNATAAYATGDSVVRLKIAYRVHNTGL